MDLQEIIRLERQQGLDTCYEYFKMDLFRQIRISPYDEKFTLHIDGSSKLREAIMRCFTNDNVTARWSSNEPHQIVITLPKFDLPAKTAVKKEELLEVSLPD